MKALKIFLGIVLGSMLIWFFAKWPNGLETVKEVTGLPEVVALLGSLLILFLLILLYLGFVADDLLVVFKLGSEQIVEGTRESWEGTSPDDKRKIKAVVIFLVIVSLIGCLILNSTHPEVVRSFFPAKPTPTASPTPTFITVDRTYNTTDRVTALQNFQVECYDPISLTIEVVPTGGLKIVSTTCKATP